MWIAIPDESSGWSITSSDHETSFILVYESISYNLPLMQDFMETSLPWTLIINYENEKQKIIHFRSLEKGETNLYFLTRWHFWLLFSNPTRKCIGFNHLSYKRKERKKWQQNAFAIFNKKNWTFTFYQSCNLNSVILLLVQVSKLK